MYNLSKVEQFVENLQDFKTNDEGIIIHKNILKISFAGSKLFLSLFILNAYREKGINKNV
jgi:hypothetical protein